MTRRGRGGTRTAFSGALRNRGRGPETGEERGTGGRTCSRRLGTLCTIQGADASLASGPRSLGTIRLLMNPRPNNRTPWLMRAMFPRWRPATTSSPAPFPTVWTAAGSELRGAAELPPDAQVLDLASRHGRFFDAGGQPIPRLPRRGRRSDRAHAATGPRPRIARRRLRRCRPAALCRQLLRLRLHRLWPAQFSRSEAGAGAKSNASRVRRPAGEPGFLPARQRLCCGPYLAYLYAQGTFWGFVLHGQPRVYTYIPDSLRSFVSIDEFSSLLRRRATRRCDARSYILGGIGLHWAAKRE